MMLKNLFLESYAMCSNCENYNANRVTIFLVILVLIIVLVSIGIRQDVVAGLALGAIIWSSQPPEHFENTPSFTDIPIDNSDIVSYEISRGSSLYIPETVVPESNDLDFALTKRHQFSQELSKTAIDGRVRHTKNTYQNVYELELEENESRDWWSSEAADTENSFWTFDE